MSFIIIASILTLLLNLFLFIYEIYIFKNAPSLENIDSQEPINTSLTIIIPAFNEELNIVNSLKALSKIKKPCSKLKIRIIDDSSEDNTFLKANECKRNFFKNTIDIEVIKAGERPSSKNWVGKNWACFVGTRDLVSDWLLFLDADVVVGERSIYNALAKSYTQDIDLLSLAPKVNCNCIAEWLVQPIMTSLLIIGFPISSTNNKDSNVAFAAGPFMLFKKRSYDKIGGHKDTYNEIVEDIALAQKIKNNNLKLNFSIAIKDISLNMYKDFNSLIEGWSKNWFLGLERDIFKSFSASTFVFFIYPLPWLILILLPSFSHIIFDRSKFYFIFILCFASILIYGLKRLWFMKNYNLPMNYWYLNWLGGIVVIYISLLSIYKTFTGIGWTWKGRKLSK